MPQARPIGLLLCLVSLLVLLGGIHPSPAAAAAAPCPAGKALYDSGRLTAAETAYTEALKEPTTEACAKAGLREIDAGPNECATATALKEAGREDQSLGAFEKVLEARPGSECAKEGLEGSDADPFWQDPKETAETVGAWFGLLAAALGILAILVSLLLFVLTRLPVIRDRGPWKRIRAVRVSIESFEDSAEPARGAALAALVRSKGEHSGVGIGNIRMVDSKAAAEEAPWDKFAKMGEQAQALGAFVGLVVALYPRRQFQATGVLQADSGNGPGLTLSYRRNAAIVDAITLWPQEYGLTVDKGEAAKPPKDEGDDEGPVEADRLQKLAVPAAAWISHVTVTAAKEKPGGARRALSWALFKTAIEWEQDGSREKAVDLYERAIEEDSSNWGALAQLGKLENEANRYGKAIGLLREALAILERKKSELSLPRPRQNSDWYRVKFRLASTLANEGADKPATAAASFAAAGREIDELLAICWRMLEPLPLERMRKKNRDTRHFVANVVEPAALVLKAVIDLGQRNFDPGDDESRLALATVHRWLRRGKPVTPLTIMEAVAADQEHPGQSLLLDLACFFALSRRPGDMERAKRHADEAFAKAPADQRDALRARAAKDPMLKRIPGIATAPKDPGRHRCQWKKSPSEEVRAAPPRPWF